MNDLIAIGSEVIGGSHVQTVDARELHTFLGVKSEFRNWIKNRIEDFGFVQGIDFIAGNFLPGSERIDYHLTVDMAKQLAMVERNEKGTQARLYFIECERRLKSQTPPSLPNFADEIEAARAWADAREAEKKALLQLAAAKPAVEFVERFVDASGSKGIREVAKLLRANEREFISFLIDRQIMYRLGGRLTPYAQHLDAGRFEVKAGVAQNEHAYTTARFTAKGIQWIGGLWIARQCGSEA